MMLVYIHIFEPLRNYLLSGQINFHADYWKVKNGVCGHFESGRFTKRKGFQTLWSLSCRSLS